MYFLIRNACEGGGIVATCLHCLNEFQRENNLFFCVTTMEVDCLYDGLSLPLDVKGVFAPAHLRVFLRTL